MGIILHEPGKILAGEAYGAGRDGLAPGSNLVEGELPFGAAR